MRPQTSSSPPQMIFLSYEDLDKTHGCIFIRERETAERLLRKKLITIRYEAVCGGVNYYYKEAD